MKKIKVTINGLETEAKEGEMIIDFAKRMGKDIPHLCYNLCFYY